MDAQPGGLDGKLFEIFVLRLEAQDVASSAVPGIPIAGDLDGVLLVQHGVENRLLGKTRGKLAPAARADQRKLVFANRSIESECLDFAH
jgi:hypothetical protein